VVCICEISGILAGLEVLKINLVCTAFQFAVGAESTRHTGKQVVGFGFVKVFAYGNFTQFKKCLAEYAETALVYGAVVGCDKRVDFILVGSYRRRCFFGKRYRRNTQHSDKKSQCQY